MTPPNASITVTVNGEPRALDAGITVGALLQSLDLAGKRLAVERNGEIVPRATHPHALLVEGDRIEIVVAVGGG